MIQTHGRPPESELAALREQLAIVPSHPPGTFGFPPERPRSTHVAGVAPEYQQADRHASYQTGSLTLAASTAFQTVITFGGAADEVDLRASAAGVEWRLGRRGRTPYDAFTADNTRDQHFTVPVETVEARDPAGAGGQVVRVIGRFIRPAPQTQD